MNKLMGTKWFTFYTKVRPILSGLFLLAVLESFRLNLAIYTKIWWLTLSFAGAVAQFVLCILIAVKSGGDYPHFVRFTRKVLLFETIYTAYQQGVETYVRNFDMISALIVFFVISIVLYFRSKISRNYWLFEPKCRNNAEITYTQRLQIASYFP